MHRKIMANAHGRFEVLEPRALLAGDVTAVVVDGLLLVDGDAEGNQIRLQSGNLPGDFVVRGIANSGTTINGQAQPQVLSGVRGIAAALGAGDDVLVIDEARTPGNVFIRTGPGNDEVVLGRPDAPMPTTDRPSVAIGGGLQVMTGAGDDRVVAADLVVAEFSSVHTGEGDDTLHVGRPPRDTGGLRPSVALGGALKIHMGIGQDLMTLNQVAVRGSLLALGGAGDDRMVLNHVAVSRAMAVWSGAGQDDVAVQETSAATAMLNTGAGDDHAAIVDSTFRSLSVQLGAGNDTLAVMGTDVIRDAMFNGGRGNDRLLNGGDNQFGALRIVGFEPPDSEAVV